MKHVHFLGIGGSGTSAIAAIAQAQGFKISGCDKAIHSEFTTDFDPKILFEGHSPDHLEGVDPDHIGVDILAVTPAIFSLDPNNSELLAAQEKGIEILTWQHFMGKYLEEGKVVIAVSGTHGKSTTTAMIGLMLESAGLDPTVELGAIIPKWGKNYRVGNGKYFITEADEFNDNFLASIPTISVVTTIEMDHPEYFKDYRAYQNSFRTFLRKTKEIIFANMGDRGVIETIGTRKERTEDKKPYKQAGIVDYSHQLIDFPLKVPGKHNILNASAAYQVGLYLEIDPQTIKQSLMSFTGIGRRFEYLGKFEEAEVYSDFAHHPTEIKVTLAAAREKFPDKKILTIFQPHMFSRTHALFDDFVKVLKEAPVDKTYILDIYPSREVDTGLVNSKQLVEAVNNPSVAYISSQNQVLEELKKITTKDYIIFFVGAGDIHKLAQRAAGQLPG